MKRSDGTKQKIKTMTFENRTCATYCLRPQSQLCGYTINLLTMVHMGVPLVTLMAMICPDRSEIIQALYVHLPSLRS